MTRCKVATLVAVLLVSCLPAKSPSASYGDALRACDAKPSEIEWIECCVKAAQSYGRDPNFCFQ